MKRISRTLGATAVVAVSMGLGATLALVYAWFLAPTGPTGEPVSLSFPTRLETPTTRRGEVTREALFDEAQVAGVYERAAPAVVAIYTTSDQRGGAGSGVIVDPSGIVLTNHHVVRGATRIEVALSDRTRYGGEVLGTDPQDDLAVVRLVDAPGGLPALTLGDSRSLRPGALAVAIGNPLGYERSVTVGVVSGLNRTLRERDRPPLRNAIQTDAAINPGNSGGPLLNSQAEVIGINTAIERVSGQQGFGGIGFAVPATTAARYLDRMLAGETIEHPWLGIAGSDVTPTLAKERGLTVTVGALVASVEPESPAQLAGLRAGDVLISLGGQPIRTMDDLGELMDGALRPGQPGTLGVVRGEQRLEVGVTFAPWPERLRPGR
jgi:S1-C subfamily serine protease